VNGVLAGAVLKQAGDAACVLEFGSRIEPAVLDKVSALQQAVQQLQRAGRLPGLTESVPTFRSLALLFDPLSTTPEQLIATIGDHVVDTDVAAEDAPRAWSLPVHYGAGHAPDLDDVARATGLSPQEVVEKHLARPLVVYMLGFLPGFGFLGDIDPVLQLPRRTSPRLRVPAGSVAIANSLSAVYPWKSPGGWHLLGHCPIPLFKVPTADLPGSDDDSPALLRAADRVRFVSIDAGEHAALVRDNENGRLDPTPFHDDASTSPR